MSTIKKKGDLKKAPAKKDQSQTRKTQQDNKKAAARKSHEYQPNAEAIVHEAKDDPLAMVDEPKDRAQEAEIPEESPNMGSQELEDI